MKKIVIFLGVPGSGKGTQAKNLAEKFGYVHLSTGDLLREMSKDENLSGDDKELLNSVLTYGHLMPDEYIFRLAFEAMDKILTEGKGVVLDGAIRTLDQAIGFEKYFENRKLSNEVLVIEVFIPDEESFKRLAGRRMCGKCKSIFTVNSDSEEKCVKCGGVLTRRTDDNPETVKRRIEKQGNNSIAPIKNYYKTLGVLETIDGTKSIEEVALQIENTLLSKIEVNV